jgi:Ca2+-binding RTX toxin-like protein
MPHMVSRRWTICLAVVAALLVPPTVAVSPASSQTLPTRLVYSTHGGPVYSARGDGSGVKLFPNTGNWENPRWSPDGSQFLFQRRSEDRHYWEIFVATSDGEVARQLTNNYVNDENPFWSPDGRKVGYLRGKSLWTMNADGTGKERLAGLGVRPSRFVWSPDGSRIAYSHWTNEFPAQPIVEIIKADGSDASTPAEIHGFHSPAWSPDGTKLVLSRTVRAPSDHRVEVWLADPDGTNPSLLLTGPQDNISPTWSPNGDAIAFTRHGNIFAVAASGGDAGLLHNAESGVQFFDWGRALECTEQGTGSGDVLAGTAGDDVICGGDGADRIIASAGNDLILGGLGVDKVDYREGSRGVVVDLRLGTASGGHRAQLLGIEGILGSAHDDVLFGDDSRNVLFGYGGDDALVGRGGDDTLAGGDGNDVARPGADGDDVNGGDGRDTVSFFDATERVRVNLANHFAFGQGEDIVLAIEKVVGSDFDDFIIGDGAANVLRGGDGADSLDGQNGPDDLFGGDERDFLYGRDGVDELYGEDGRDYADGGDDDDACYSISQQVSC